MLPGQVLTLGDMRTLLDLKSDLVEAHRRKRITA
jgi:hypothetical protein